jgi:hypothetical protein
MHVNKTQIGQKGVDSREEARSEMFVNSLSAPE